MNKEIIDLVERYKDDDELKKFTHKYYADFSYTEPVKSKEDMSRMTMGIDATLNYYEELKHLSDGDIEVMERRVAEYELAVFKMLENADNNTDYSSYDLRRLIDHIGEYYVKLESIERKDRVLNSEIGYNF